MGTIHVFTTHASLQLSSFDTACGTEGTGFTGISALQNPDAGHDTCLVGAQGSVLRQSSQVVRLPGRGSPELSLNRGMGVS